MFSMSITIKYLSLLKDIYENETVHNIVAHFYIFSVTAKENRLHQSKKIKDGRKTLNQH